MIRLKLSIFGLVILLSGCNMLNKGQDVIQVAPVPQVTNKFTAKVLWQQKIGDGVKQHYSQLRPALAYNKLFAASRSGIVAALQPETGQIIWQQDIAKLSISKNSANKRANARLSGGIVAAYNRLYIGSENADLFALDSKTGKLLWQIKTPGEVISSPAVAEGTLIVISASGEVSAYNAFSGEQKWVKRFNLPTLTLRSQSEPVIANGAVLFGRSNGYLTVAALDSGKLIQNYKLASPKGTAEIERIVDVDGRAVVLDNTVYAIAFNGYLVAIDLSTGQMLWQSQYSSYRNIAIAGNDILLTDSQSQIFSIDSRNGTERWSNKLLTWRGLTAPIIIGKYVVVGDAEGYLYWLDKKQGQILSIEKYDSLGFYIAPIADTGSMYLQSRSGILYAIVYP